MMDDTGGGSLSPTITMKCTSWYEKRGTKEPEPLESNTYSCCIVY